MGTDIHLYVEARGEDGVWHRVRPKPWKCSWCNGERTVKAGPYHKTPGAQIPCVHCEGKGEVTEEYGDRNYDLFAMLANVRNGSGFAGIETGDGFVPLSEPRGLPDDLSFPAEPDWSDDEAADNEPYLGDHSFSWATLRELLDYDYDRVTRHSGVVDSVEYAEWMEKGRGRPDRYCGGVSGPGVKHVSNVEMQKLIATGAATTVRAPEPPPPTEAQTRAAMDAVMAALSGRGTKEPSGPVETRYYTRVSWEETYRESAGQGWFSFLEACKPLGDPDKVRLVFGFDS